MIFKREKTKNILSSYSSICIGSFACAVSVNTSVYFVFLRCPSAQIIIGLRDVALLT